LEMFLLEATMFEFIGKVVVTVIVIDLTILVINAVNDVTNEVARKVR
jgi:hypothetical protein